MTITRLRQAIAFSLALVAFALTLGRTRPNWTGRPSAPDEADDPGRAAAVRLRDDLGASPPV